jgi:hypothetical protein
MEEELIKRLEKRVVEAMRACAVTHPTPDKPPEYQWGYLQGKYAAWLAAIQLVEAYIREQDEEFEEELQGEEVGAS